MAESPNWIQWITALSLLAVFVGVILTFFLDLISFDRFPLTHSKKRAMGILLLVLVGGAWYGVAREVLVFVWKGLRYILGMEFEGL